MVTLLQFVFRRLQLQRIQNFPFSISIFFFLQKIVLPEQVTSDEKLNNEA